MRTELKDESELDRQGVLGFPGGSDRKESAYGVGDQGSVPGSGGSPGEGNGNLIQCSCLENPMDRGAWQATVHRVTKSRTELSNFTFTFTGQERVTWTEELELGGRTRYVMTWKESCRRYSRTETLPL